MKLYSKEEMYLSFSILNVEKVEGLDMESIDYKSIEESDIETMIEKGILERDENGNADFSKDSFLCFSTIARPDAYITFCKEDDALHYMNLYIKGASIVYTVMQGEEIGVKWIPTIPLAIGSYAGFWKEFALEETIISNEKLKKTFYMNDQDLDTQLLQYLEESLIENEPASKIFNTVDETLKISGYDIKNPENNMKMFIWGNDKKYVQCTIKGKNATYSIPNKEDAINSITDWFAGTYSSVLKKEGKQ